MDINDDLLINYLLGETSAEENKHVKLWCNAAPANQIHFEQLRKVWDLSKTLQYSGELDVAASLQRLKDKAQLRNASVPKVVPVFGKRRWYQLVAALFLVCGATWIYTSFIGGREVEFSTRQLVATDTLSDGSVITLNKNSQLTYPRRFQGQQRLVALTKGEAFFSISPNKQQPFVITTGSTTIKVVGTSFNVKNKAGAIEVIVETGVVEVTENGKKLTLHPGEMAKVETKSRALVRATTKDLLYNYYRSKQFIANNTPLWRMVQVLNEAYNSQIIIGRKELNNLPLNTTFNDESLAEILQVISSTFNIRIEKKAQQIILY
jgi:transmembrane sensor